MCKEVLLSVRPTDVRDEKLVQRFVHLCMYLTNEYKSTKMNLHSAVFNILLLLRIMNTFLLFIYDFK